MNQSVRGFIHPRSDQALWLVDLVSLKQHVKREWKTMHMEMVK